MTSIAILAAVTFHDANLIVNIAGLVVLCGGILAYSRLKAALEAVSTTSTAWQSERDAEKAKADRLAGENSALIIEVTKLRAQPDITRLYALMEKHDERTSQIGSELVATLGLIVGRLEALEHHARTT